MHCFAHEEHPKLFSNNCKLLPSLIREVCAHCHFSCLGTASPFNSEEDETLSDCDIDNKHVIILEIRSRAMKAKQRPKDYLFAQRLGWVLSPTTGKLLIAPRGEENGGGDYDDCESTEGYYSVKSCFSRCSSMTMSECKYFSGRSILEEFCQCEGWPFGLCRKAMMLPPLPSSPSDSWTWSKRSLVNKVCTAA